MTRHPDYKCKGLQQGRPPADWRKCSEAHKKPERELPMRSRVMRVTTRIWSLEARRWKALNIHTVQGTVARVIIGSSIAAVALESSLFRDTASMYQGTDAAGMCWWLHLEKAWGVLFSFSLYIHNSFDEFCRENGLRGVVLFVRSCYWEELSVVKD